MMDTLLALDQTIQRLEAAWMPEHPTYPSYFDYVPLPMSEFLSGLEVCQNYIMEREHCWPSPTFLDVGCGIGTKMVVAQYRGWTVSGIELDPAMAETARRFTHASITTADAFTCDRFDADVVYSYRLCHDIDRQHELEAYMAARMKPGALLFIAGSTVFGLHQIGDQVWVV